MPETKLTIHNMVWRKMNEQGTYTKLPLIHDMREGVDSKGQNIYIHIDKANTIHSGYYSCMSQRNTKLSRNFQLKVKGKRIFLMSYYYSLQFHIQKGSQSRRCHSDEKSKQNHVNLPSPRKTSSRSKLD